MSLFSGVAAFLREAPIELYRFELGGETYRYAATSGEPYVYKGDVYAPEYLLRVGLHFSNDFAKDVLTITLPATNAVAALFFSGTPEYAMRLKVFRGVRGAADLPAVWSGTVNGASFSFSDEAYTCDLSCEPLAARMERSGLIRNYQINCPHTLYGPHCRVDRTARRLEARVSESTGSTLTLSLPSGTEDGRFAGGQLITAADGRRRCIMGNAGNVLTLERPLLLKKSDTVTLYPGCDKSWACCVSRFGNGLNFGGHRWIPTENPFVSPIG